VADIGSAIRGYLAANAGVAALVATRIYPDVLPQGYTIKNGGALTYTVIDTIHDHFINGISGIARSRIEFAAFAPARVDANLIAESVRTSDLQGYTGAIGGIVICSVMISGGIQTLDERPTDGSQEHRYTTIFDYLIAHQEST